MTEWMSYPAYYTEGSGRPPRRTGMRHATISPYGPFRTGNGKIVFFGIQNEREWEAFCTRVLGAPELVHDARFATNSLRMQNRDELEALIEQHFAAYSDDEVMERLETAAIANANMNTVETFLQHPQLHERGRVQQVGSPRGPLMSFLPPVTIPGLQPVMGPVPAVGEHTDSILAELEAAAKAAE
jgi:crotonobetainyl-CoA:carnitine CoA-transferase CaiB-like acyl-CoA transferase